MCKLSNCYEISPRKGLQKLLFQTNKWKFDTVLDIGTGSGFAARYFAQTGKTVIATGFCFESYLANPLPEQVKVVPEEDVCEMTTFPDESFDAVWCSHVIEHVQNVGLALAEIHRILRPQGRLFIIVPEYIDVLVGGHVSTGWNIGTLMYNLVLAGFNVREGEFINFLGNVCGYVTRGELPNAKLVFDKGDIEKLVGYFPNEINVHQRMNVSMLLKVNWNWHEPIRARAESEFNNACARRLLKNWLPPVLVDFIRWLKTLRFRAN